MIKSMTGFGRGENQEEGKAFIVEIKTVNHRYSDIFIKMPRQLTFLEEKIREKLSKAVSRGKIDIYISFENYGDNGREVLLDEPLVNAYMNAVNKLREKYSLKDDISVSLISSFPDVLRVEKAEEDQNRLWTILSGALCMAIDNLVRMREKEGTELRNSILQKMIFMEENLEIVKRRAPDIVKEYKIKLENRIRELLDQKPVDEYRIATEVAVFADRCSVDEEIVRMGSHMMQMRQTLDVDEPIGRKLDFIIQEMNREINTIGSKANDLSILRCVVEIKSEIEKMREQVQNIE